MNVSLLTYTEDPLATIYTAYRQCYSSEDAEELFAEAVYSGSEEKMGEFVKSVMSSGHTSPIESVSFSFSISGVSRNCSHQLVRHRLASYAQRSQRYVDMNSFPYVTPPKIKRRDKIARRYHAFMEDAAEFYEWLVAQGVPKEDARFVIPSACETSLVMTMNCRSLLNFFAERCCARAQWEIRVVANEMLKQVREVLPAVFGDAGAKCEKLKVCPEGKKFSCGKYPIFELK